ncbi:hypothetical protein [Rubidibacter lacunae]|nr:hypothetical protein [Rubidibacter lacunae]
MNELEPETTGTSDGGALVSNHTDIDEPRRAPAPAALPRESDLQAMNRLLLDRMARGSTDISDIERLADLCSELERRGEREATDRFKRRMVVTQTIVAIATGFVTTTIGLCLTVTVSPLLGPVAIVLGVVGVWGKSLAQERVQPVLKDEKTHPSYTFLTGLLLLAVVLALLAATIWADGTLPLKQALVAIATLVLLAALDVLKRLATGRATIVSSTRADRVESTMADAWSEDRSLQP